MLFFRIYHGIKFIIVKTPNRLADLIEQNKTAFANIEVLDNGKPFAEADFDIQCSIDTFRYYAGYADKIHGNTIPAGKHDIIFLLNFVFNCIAFMYHGYRKANWDHDLFISFFFGN